MKFGRRIKQLEAEKRRKSVMPPVFVKSLDELDPDKEYTAVFTGEDQLMDDPEHVQIHGYYANHPIEDSWKGKAHG